MHQIPLEKKHFQTLNHNKAFPVLCHLLMSLPASIFQNIPTRVSINPFSHLEFPVGSISEVLLGFGNTGDKAFKVQAVKGHLVAAQDYTYFIQNFTTFGYNVTVEPDEVNTILYKFKLDKNLDTREFGVIFEVFYLNQDNDTFATTFFNETITLTEAEETFDPKAIASYVGLIFTLSVLGFVFYKMFSNSSFAKRFNKTKSAVVVDVDANRKDVNTDWIPSHLADSLKKKQKKEEETKKEK